MSAGGELVVGVEVPEFGSGKYRFLLRPGLSMTCEVMLMIDGQPRRVALLLDVAGSVCPDPSAHVRPCDETDQNTYGDCAGEVREYVMRTPIATVQVVGDRVLLCASHAQQHGRHIRKVTR